MKQIKLNIIFNDHLFLNIDDTTIKLEKNMITLFPEDPIEFLRSLSTEERRSLHPLFHVNQIGFEVVGRKWIMNGTELVIDENKMQLKFIVCGSSSFHCTSKLLDTIYGNYTSLSLDIVKIEDEDLAENGDSIHDPFLTKEELDRELDEIAYSRC